MANPISQNVAIGTIGELLVQLRLLQYGVQAAPPLKDSGNDLVALKGYEVRTIQVKCSAVGFPQIRNLPERYHLLALVALEGHEETLLLDQTKVYLVPRENVAALASNTLALAPYILCREQVEKVFAQSCAPPAS